MVVNEKKYASHGYAWSSAAHCGSTTGTWTLPVIVFAPSMSKTPVTEPLPWATWSVNGSSPPWEVSAAAVVLSSISSSPSFAPRTAVYGAPVGEVDLVAEAGCDRPEVAVVRARRRQRQIVVRMAVDRDRPGLAGRERAGEREVGAQVVGSAGQGRARGRVGGRPELRDRSDGEQAAVRGEEVEHAADVRCGDAARGERRHEVVDDLADRAAGGLGDVVARGADLDRPGVAGLRVGSGRRAGAGRPRPRPATPCR